MPRPRQQKPNLVCEKVDKLVAAEREAHPERLVAFFARLQTNYDEAIRAASSFFLLMLAAWLLTHAIYTGRITKFTLLGVEFNSKMLIASPPLIGLLTYGMLSSLAAAVVLWEAVSRGAFHMLPAAWEHSLDDLLAPPSFSNVERMLEPRPESRLPWLFSLAWFVLVSFLMFIGSFLAVAYTIVLLFLPPLKDNPVLGLLSALLGVVAWLRGVVLFRAAINATGGFNLSHHRWSGRAGVGEESQHPNAACGPPRVTPSAPPDKTPAAGRDVPDEPAVVVKEVVLRPISLRPLVVTKLRLPRHSRHIIR